MQSHFGRATLRQDQEILRYRLGDIAPRLMGDDADLVYTGKVAGEATFEGRPVVVLRTNGGVLLEGELMRIKGIAYIDEATGVSVYTDARLVPIGDKSSNVTIRSVQRLEIEEWLRANPAAAGKGEVGPCGGGRSVQA